MSYIDEIEQVGQDDFLALTEVNLWEKIQNLWAVLEDNCREEGYDIFKGWSCATELRYLLYKADPEVADLSALIKKDLDQLRIKDRDYGGSWLKRGGVGAFMMLCRKMDRILKQMEGCTDLIYIIRDDARPEGILDDLRDLRCYLILCEAELIARGKRSLLEKLSVARV